MQIDIVRLSDTEYRVGGMAVVRDYGETEWRITHNIQGPRNPLCTGTLENCLNFACGVIIGFAPDHKHYALTDGQEAR